MLSLFSYVGIYIERGLYAISQATNIHHERSMAQCPSCTHRFARVRLSQASNDDYDHRDQRRPIPGLQSDGITRNINMLQADSNRG